MTVCSDDFLFADDFGAVLVIPRSLHYNASASKTAEEIARSEKDCHKCSLCVIICIATEFQ